MCEIDLSTLQKWMQFITESIKTINWIELFVIKVSLTRWQLVLIERNPIFFMLHLLHYTD